MRSLGAGFADGHPHYPNQLVLENGLPFRPKADPFFCASNMRHLKRLHEDYRADRNIVSRERLKDQD